jgi:TolB-like protein
MKVIACACLLLIVSSSTAVTRQSNLDKGMEELSQQISKQVIGDKKLALAVADFTDLKGNDTCLGSFLAEQLTPHLYQTNKFTLLERTLLNKVIKEQKVSLNELTDPKTAIRLGRIMNAGAIVTGSVTDLGEILRVNVELINAETGVISATAVADILNNRDMRHVSENCAPQPTPTPTPQPTPAPTPALSSPVCEGDEPDPLIKQAWAAFDKAKGFTKPSDFEKAIPFYEKAIACAKVVTDKWTPAADRQQAMREKDQVCDDAPELKNKAEVDKFWKSYWAVNHVATAWYIRGMALKGEKKSAEAKEAFQKVIDNYDCAFTFDPRPPAKFWKTADGARAESANIP